MAIDQGIQQDWLFGSRIPYAEGSWARGCPSPYYTDSHRRLRRSMREWMEKHIIPFANEWEERGELPADLYESAARAGIVMPSAAGRRIPPEWRGKYPIIGDVDPAEWDGFHDFILHDEFGRVGGVGVENGLLGGATLVVSALHKFGVNGPSPSANAAIRQIIHEVLSGKSRICLTITEPGAGSDVAGITTEAVLSEDGRAFCVNGQKKWITSGMYCKYFFTLVQDVAVGGQTLLVIPKTAGVSTRRMKMTGSGSAGTAFIEFDDVLVPVTHVVGERGQGFKYIMANFNHERLFIGMQALRCARICLQDSMEYAQSRSVSGKKLIEQPVVRFKFAHMSRKTEALQSWLESLIFQLDRLSSNDAILLLAGTTAHFKAHSGIVLEYVVREAVQILGGIGLTRGGRGERVERIWRDVKAITVPGGSEEVLLDLAVRRSLKIQNVLSKL